MKFKQQKDIGLRVVLEFEEESRELATLPWEYIYYPESKQGFFIATRGKLILTRHVPLKVADRNLRPEDKPLRILIVVCQPAGMDPIKAVPDIIETIKNLQHKMPDNIMLDRLDQPTKTSFSKKVKEFSPHVLHFIGYGKSDDKQSGYLAFVYPDEKDNKADKTVHWIKPF